MNGFLIGACCIAFLLAESAGVAAGQHDSNASAAARRPTRVLVTVTLTDTSAPEPGYRIMRRADEPPYDVIVLMGRADAVTLSDAVSDLLLVRMAQGDTATRAGAVRVRRNRPADGADRVPRFPWAQRVVDDLRRAEPRAVPGVGNARVVEIWLPPQHVRAAPPSI